MDIPTSAYSNFIFHHHLVIFFGSIILPSITILQRFSPNHPTFHHHLVTLSTQSSYRTSSSCDSFHPIIIPYFVILSHFPLDHRIFRHHLGTFHPIIIT